MPLRVVLALALLASAHAACTPACQNGGRCTLLNQTMCACPYEYSGSSDCSIKASPMALSFTIDSDTLPSDPNREPSQVVASLATQALSEFLNFTALPSHRVTLTLVQTGDGSAFAFPGRFTFTIFPPLLDQYPDSNGSYPLSEEVYRAFQQAIADGDFQSDLDRWEVTSLFASQDMSTTSSVEVESCDGVWVQFGTCPLDNDTPLGVQITIILILIAFFSIIAYMCYRGYERRHARSHYIQKRKQEEEEAMSEAEASAAQSDDDSV